MADEFTDMGGRAVGFLLDQEAPLRHLTSLIIALDLILSNPDGIDGEDMPGARIVAVFARERAAAIREVWREAVAQVRAGDAG